MPKPAAAVVGLVCLGMLGAGGIAVAGAPAESHRPRALVISNDGGVLANIPLSGNTSRRATGTPSTAPSLKSVHGPGGREATACAAAADQLAVLEEVPRRSRTAVRGWGHRPQGWVTDPTRGVLRNRAGSSLAATDLGRRTVYILGAPLLEVMEVSRSNSDPFVALSLKETLMTEHTERQRSR